jgi:hypothetical protein
VFQHHCREKEVLIFFSLFHSGCQNMKRGVENKKIRDGWTGENLNDSWLLHRFLFNMNDSYSGETGENKEKVHSTCHTWSGGREEFLFIFFGVWFC